MTENEQKRLTGLREKIAQIRAKEKAILARDKKRQREEKTRRLIQNGMLAEKYFHCEGMNSADFEKVLQNVTDTAERRTPL